MSKNIIVLGAGLVGNAMAIDLCKDFNVTSADISEKSLEKLKSFDNMSVLKADLSDQKVLKSVIKNYDLVVGALPGFMGYRALKTIIEAGKNVVDISFFPEDPFGLDELAKEHGVTAVVDCGVAPGMSNVIMGYHNEKMKINSMNCLVGGLPLKRDWPWEYKAVFSPIDVIEEYIRPARYVENGEIIIKEALSDPELINFDKIGTLESWNSDGLRSLIKTMDVPNMKEKTLRYPGCIEYLRVLRDSGFFSYEEIVVNGHKIKPVDFTASLLFPEWKLKPGEGDFTVMKIEVFGNEKGDDVKYLYELYDEYDKKTDTISMARTTGYTCTAVANLMITENFNRKGICPPEYVGVDEKNFSFIMNYLKDRNVIYVVNRLIG